MSFFLLLNTKEDILKKADQTVDGMPLISIFIFSNYGSQWLRQLFGYQQQVEGEKMMAFSFN